MDSQLEFMASLFWVHLVSVYLSVWRNPEWAQVTALPRCLAPRHANIACVHATFAFREARDLGRAVTMIAAAQAHIKDYANVHDETYVVSCERVPYLLM